MSDPLSPERFAEIRAEFGPADWPRKIDQLTADLAEMTRCRDNALRALYRDDVETDPHLPDLFADGLHGLYDWEQEPEPDSAPQDLVDRCVQIMQPAFGKLTQQRDAFLIQRDNLRNMVLAECDSIEAEVPGQCEVASRIRGAVDAWHEYTAMTARMVQPDVTL
jgi:hypothetical protein